ncbi:MAG: hypothetical protein M3N53_07475 [Actinomycetota bacterium]|nr:hypothetical protein [Actinomycetota bacterium]
MDESMVREHAERHAQATVAGDLKAAGSDLEKSAFAAAAEVMKHMPPDLTGSDISGVRSDGDECIVSIVYRSETSSATVESRWAEREGRPKIVDLKVV